MCYSRLLFNVGSNEYDEIPSRLKLPSVNLDGRIIINVFINRITCPSTLNSTPSVYGAL
jgi:hypothetical protein